MADKLTLGRGTTPTYSIKINGFDLSAIADVYVTFEQKPMKELTKHFPEVYVGDDKVMVHLNQKETLSFKAGNGLAQIRFITHDGTAYKSATFPITITDALYEKEI